MEVEGTYIFDAPKARVWELLLDPTSLASCMPGCERLEPLGDDRYQATLSVGVGAIRGKYEATITIADQVPTCSYRLIVEGSGSPGFFRGEARISLEELDGKTLVRVQGEAQVGGTVARVGQRLMGSVNKMMMDRFFACLQKAAG
jgi:carbon monoxide dehydrogenase subunit G